MLNRGYIDHIEMSIRNLVGCKKDAFRPLSEGQHVHDTDGKGSRVRRVKWQDGGTDPYQDDYKEFSGASYWDWMNSKSPYGRDEDGMPHESLSANPDALAEDFEESVPQPSGEQILLDEALKLLTTKQRIIWDLYYKQEHTEEEIADQIGIAHQTVSKQLNAALKKIVTYCDANKGRLRGCDDECGEIG